MNEPAFELPTHVQQQNKHCLKGKKAKLNLFLTNDMPRTTEKSQETKNSVAVKDANSYHQIVVTEEGMNVANGERNIEKQEISVQTVDSRLLVNDLEDGEQSGPGSNHLQTIPWCLPHVDLKEHQPTNSNYPDLEVLKDSQLPLYNCQSGPESLMYYNFQGVQDYHEVQHIAEDNNQANYNQPRGEDNIFDKDTITEAEYGAITQDMTISSDEQSKGVVIVVDNSNIYIGAQECASASNAHDRKRHVRVKLQNLVKILEKNRLKERTFVCGSSPPATEHVWDVYR